MSNGVYNYWPNSAIATRYSPNYKTKVVLEQVNAGPVYAGNSGVRVQSYNYAPAPVRPVSFTSASFRPVEYVSTYKPVTQQVLTLPTTTLPVETKTTEIDTLTDETVVRPFRKRRYRILGYLICTLAILAFGFEVADLAVTMPANSSQNCTPTVDAGILAIPWFFSWIAPGIWASIPIFITGLLALRVSDNYGKLFQAIAVLSSISAFFFAPVIVAISAAEEATFSSACSYTADNSSKPVMQMKLIFPIIILILGILLMLLLLYLTFILCFAYEYREVSKTITLQPGIGTVAPTPVTATETVMVPIRPTQPTVTLAGSAVGGPGRVVLAAHDHGYAYTNVPGYFTAVPPTNTATTTLPAVRPNGSGYYWN